MSLRADSDGIGPQFVLNDLAGAPAVASARDRPPRPNGTSSAACRPSGSRGLDVAPDQPVVAERVLDPALTHPVRLVINRKDLDRARGDGTMRPFVGVIDL